MEDERPARRGAAQSDTFAPCDPAPPAARQRPRPDAEIVGGEVSAWRPRAILEPQIGSAQRRYFIRLTGFCNAAADARLINVRSSPDNVLIVRFCVSGPIRKGGAFI